MTTIASRTLLAFMAALVPALSSAGIFAPAAGEANSTAVDKNDANIDAWAIDYEQYQPGSNVDAEWKQPQRALGKAGNSDGTQRGTVYDIVSLGRGGSITLRFNPPIKNGAGYDFAVFENSFDGTFLELAKIEVSTNGIDFIQFPAFSQVPSPLGSFSTMDPTDVEQVAGKYKNGFGTPFDIEQLRGSANLNLNRVRYVRINDIVGNGNSQNDLTPANLADYLGIPVNQLPSGLRDIAEAAPNAIYDPFPTIGSAGFDLDAVAVLNAAPLGVDVDIDPFSTANEIDPGSNGDLFVAFRTTSVAEGEIADFDATRIKNTSLKLGDGEAKVQSAPFITDFDGDGDDDSIYSFNIQDTGLVCSDTRLDVRGSIYGGQAFEGGELINTVNCDDGCH